jgi:hypothetical protein
MQMDAQRDNGKEWRQSHERRRNRADIEASLKEMQATTANSPMHAFQCRSKLALTRAGKLGYGLILHMLLVDALVDVSG